MTGPLEFHFDSYIYHRLFSIYFFAMVLLFRLSAVHTFSYFYTPQSIIGVVLIFVESLFRMFNSTIQYDDRTQCAKLNAQILVIRYSYKSLLLEEIMILNVDRYCFV